jgi:hypothetical protein
MAYAPKSFYRQIPSTGGATVYTVPAATNAIVKSIVMTNVTTAAAECSITIGGYNVVRDVSIPAKTTLVVESGIIDVLTTGDVIAVSQNTTNAIHVRISGVTY